MLREISNFDSSKLFEKTVMTKKMVWLNHAFELTLIFYLFC